MGIFEDCFGDLPKEQQKRLKTQLNEINKLVGLRRD